MYLSMNSWEHHKQHQASRSPCRKEELSIPSPVMAPPTVSKKSRERMISSSLLAIPWMQIFLSPSPPPPPPKRGLPHHAPVMFSNSGTTQGISPKGKSVSTSSRMLTCASATTVRPVMSPPIRHCQKHSSSEVTISCPAPQRHAQTSHIDASNAIQV